MPGIGKLEMLTVEMVAVFVAKRAESRICRGERADHNHGLPTYRNLAYNRSDFFFRMGQTGA